MPVDASSELGELVEEAEHDVAARRRYAEYDPRDSFASA